MNRRRFVASIGDKTLASVWSSLSRPQQQALVYLSIPPRERRGAWPPRPTPTTATLEALQRHALAALEGKPKAWHLTPAGSRLLKDGADMTTPGQHLQPALTDVCVCGHDYGSHSGRKCAHVYAADLTCACLGFKARPPGEPLSLTLEHDQAEALDMLGRSYATGLTEPSTHAMRVRAALEHLIASATDGVRRPGSWERGWLQQAFGDIDTEPHVDGLPYHEQPRRAGKAGAS